MKAGTVLVVNGSRSVAEILGKWLEEKGFEVSLALDGGGALKSLESGMFTFVVTDVHVPGLDGMTILREARARNPMTHVIVTGEKPSVETAVEAMKQGAMDFISGAAEPEAVGAAILKAAGVAGDRPTVRSAGVDDAFLKHLNRGKELQRRKKLAEAAGELEKAVELNPSHFEARYTLGRVQEARAREASGGSGAPRAAKAKPKPKDGGAEVEAKECVWMKAKVVAYRMCHNDYQCAECDFGRMMQEQKKTGREDPAMAGMLEALKSVPAGERRCRYMLGGKVSLRTCNKLFDCQRCEYDQMMQDVVLKKK